MFQISKLLTVTVLCFFLFQNTSFAGRHDDEVESYADSHSLHKKTVTSLADKRLSHLSQFSFLFSQPGLESMVRRGELDKVAIASLLDLIMFCPKREAQNRFTVMSKAFMKKIEAECCQNLYLPLANDQEISMPQKNHYKEGVKHAIFVHIQLAIEGEKRRLVEKSLKENRLNATEGGSNKLSALSASCAWLSNEVQGFFSEESYNEYKDLISDIMSDLDTEVFETQDHYNFYTILPPADDWIRLTNLRSIHISDGGMLTSIRELAGLTNLRSIYITQHFLVSIPEIAMFAGLRSLHINGYNLKSIAEVEGLLNLNVLDTYHSPTLSCYPNFAGLTKLNHLRLSINQPTSFPNITVLTQLRLLGLEGRHLTSVPDLTRFTNLEDLDLSSENLISLSGLKNLESLRLLTLKNTPHLWSALEGENVDMAEARIAVNRRVVTDLKQMRGQEIVIDGDITE